LRRRSHGLSSWARSVCIYYVLSLWIPREYKTRTRSVRDGAVGCDRAYARSADAAVLLSALESLFDASAWSVIDPSVADEAKSELVQALARGEWVEQLVVDLEKLIATGVSRTPCIIGLS